MGVKLKYLEIHSIGDGLSRLAYHNRKLFLAALHVQSADSLKPYYIAII